MDELVNKVSERTGIPADKARAAVETVVEHLKGKLPSSISSHLDSALSGESSEATGGLAGRVGNIFGKKSA
jgi:uncharacterized protein (DUF2267 family)